MGIYARDASTMGVGLFGDPTRYYRPNKHAVCPPLSPLDTVGITPTRCIYSIRHGFVRLLFAVGPSYSTLYPIWRIPTVPLLCATMIGNAIPRRGKKFQEHEFRIVTIFLRDRLVLGKLKEMCLLERITCYEYGRCSWNRHSAEFL